MHLPLSFFESASEQMKRPEGTITFEFHSPDLTNKLIRGGKIFEIVSGKQAFILDRTDDFKINYFHSSPGSGTRVATIDLTIFPKFAIAFFCLTWSPTKISLSIGPLDIKNHELVTVEGIQSNKQIRVANDGSVFYIGDNNVKVMDISIHKEGKEILSSTAIDAWKNTKIAIDILGTGKSDKGYLFECVVTNLTLSILVTGFESYLQKRFIELEEEGIIPEEDELIFFLFSKKQKDNNFYDIIKSDAKTSKISVLKYLSNKRYINFQNFDVFKKVYNKTYGITLNSCNIDSRLINSIKKYLAYRHKIIHISPTIGLLNQNNVPPEEPVFPNEKLKLEAINKFDKFITLFHEKSLKLKRND